MRRGVETDELDHFVRAISNGTRRRILRICADSTVPAGDIAEQIDLAAASVSEHLKVLRKTGLVHLERDSTRWRYRTNTTRLAEVLAKLHEQLPMDRSDKENAHE